MRNDFETVMKRVELLYADNMQLDIQIVPVGELQPANATSDIFYYHTNHLGSTAFVTDQNQTITQGFLYAPFGEITTEYDINFGYNVLPKYSFNAKELDEETGMYYYEARYYKPPVFTSRDPMFEKYFWMTPYAYCANNPVKYVDPTGMDTLVFSQNGYFEKKLPGGNNIGMIKGSDGTYATKFIVADERWCERFVSCSDEDIKDENMDMDNIQNKTFYIVIKKQETAL